MIERGRRSWRGVLARVVSTVAAIVWTGAPAQALAAPYDAFIEIEDEDDLYDLVAVGVLEEDDVDDLVYLLDRGVDLQTATREQLYALPNLTYAQVDRILAYREEVGVITDPASLVVADVIDQKLLRSIAPFLLVPADGKAKADARGFVRYRTVWSVEDRQVPPMALQARVSTLRYLTIGGAMLLDRTRPTAVTYDPNRDALVSDGLQPSVRAAKYYAAWEAPHWGIIVGTYNIGFGQKLVFDSTGRYTPNGFLHDDMIYRRTRLQSQCRLSHGEFDDSPCSNDDGTFYNTPDYRIREGLRGVALGTDRIELPTGWAQAYGFFSYQTRSLYQYTMYRPDRCDDPRSDADECKAPPIYRRPDGDPLGHANTLSYVTIPGAYNEILGGANLGYYYNRRTHIGFTGYGADVQWLMRGIDLDFAENSRYPSGGPWGAVGSDLSWGRKWADIFFEFAYAFDNSPYGSRGGPAAILRHTATWNTHEIEASARYYDTGFANPYARSIAQPDQFEGNRARDEAGVRVRYSGVLFGRWTLKALVDGWGSPRGGNPKFQAYVRSDVQALKWFRPGLWVEYRTRRLQPQSGNTNDIFVTEDGDLQIADATSCYGSGESSDPEASTAGCANGLRVRARSRFDVHKRVYFTIMYQHAWIGERCPSTTRAPDDPMDPEIVMEPEGPCTRQDMTSAVQLTARPIDEIRLRFQVRHYDYDIKDNHRLENSVWAYAQVTYAGRRWMMPSLRYDVRAWLDERDSTALRRPNPEHWIHFQLESRF